MTAAHKSSALRNEIVRTFIPVCKALRPELRRFFPKFRIVVNSIQVKEGRRSFLEPVTLPFKILFYNCAHKRGKRVETSYFLHKPFKVLTISLHKFFPALGILV